ncbi:MAG: LptF/LptG family permease, partial [Tabrizicola sp.]|nr:LptF/LptG family permease [Tabrizicola sp.]
DEGPLTLASDLTAERIRDSFGSPSTIAFWDLPDYIDDLERAGFSSQAHRLWFHMELAQPLLLAAMVLVAAGFTMRHVRSGGTGRMVLFAMLAGFGIFFLRNFAQAMGNSGQIPILLAAWSPPAIALLMSLGFLLHLEDG